MGIRTLIVEDVEDIREYIAESLEKESDIEIMGQVNSGMAALDFVSKQKPDVILMDIQMESPTAGLEAAESIKQQFPDIRIITLTIHEDDHLIFRAYCAGVMDYLLKTAPKEEIAEAVRNVHNNKMMVRSNIASKIIHEFTKLRTQQESTNFTYSVLSKLTNSEFEILAQVFEGHKYKEIAEMRFVSMGTIKSQVNSILKKFQKKKMKDVLVLLEKMNFGTIIADNRSNSA